MEALKAEGVRHVFGRGAAETVVLDGFDLTLQRGAFEALMGPSGSGKSTFLHLAAGLLTPAAGRIEIGETDVTGLSDSAAAKFRRRHVGVVFQSFNLIDELTIVENIVLPVRLDRGRPDLARCAALITKLGLTGKEKRHPSELSGGERQRAAIARALFAEPDVILADEPTGNLDVNAARDIRTLLETLNREESTAVLLVTHDPVVAASASKVHFLKNGRIAASFATNHDPAEISARYLETYR